MHEDFDDQMFDFALCWRVVSEMKECQGIILLPQKNIHSWGDGLETTATAFHIFLHHPNIHLLFIYHYFVIIQKGFSSLFDIYLFPDTHSFVLFYKVAVEYTNN
jgi:hypothetical protein